MRLIRATDLELACPMIDAIDAVARGFMALSDGTAHVPVRIHVPLRDEGLAGAMPASLEGSPYYSVKVVSIAPAAARRGLPLIGATVLLGDAGTGAAVALVEGAALTSLRTGAAGGVAARALAGPGPAVVALFGAGAQARTQLEALVRVREVSEARVAARDPRHTRGLVDWAAGRFPGLRVRATSAADAVAGAGIVVTATDSATPVFDGRWLAEGAHVTAVGSHRPHMRELDDATLRDALIAVDQRDGALAEAGELVGLGPADVVEIGEILAGTAAGRTSPEQRTIFKSVGNAIQDLVVASLAYERALERGIGEEIRWP